METPKHLLYDCIKVKSQWKNVNYLIQYKTDWKHIVTGNYQTNTLTQFIKVCISIVRYSIYSGWIICKIKCTAYEKLDIEKLCYSKVIFFSKVLSNTKKFKHIGKQMYSRFKQ